MPRQQIPGLILIVIIPRLLLLLHLIASEREKGEKERERERERERTRRINFVESERERTSTPKVEKNVFLIEQYEITCTFRPFALFKQRKDEQLIYNLFAPLLLVKRLIAEHLQVYCCSVP